MTASQREEPDLGALDAALLSPILRDLGVAPPLALTPLIGGSNRVFRIDLADGSAVVLKTYDDLRAKFPAREAHAARLLEGLNLPVTRYLALDETCARLPFRYAITNYLPGETAGSLRGDPGIADVYRQMGELLRKLHGVKLPAFGHFDDRGTIEPPVANQADYMRSVADHAFAQFRRYGGAATLAERLAAIVAARRDVFVQSRGPVFAHDDMHPRNVLVVRDSEGRLQLSGLIDFGNARAADAVFDLAKTLFICQHEAPGSTSHILAGYGPIDHPDPEAALWLYTLLHRVIMWWWLRHVGIIPDGPDDHDLILDLHRMVEEASR